MPGTVRATKPPRALRSACESSSGGKSLGSRQRDKGHRRPDGAAREGAQAAGLGAGAPACAAGAKAAAEAAGAGAGAAAPLPGDRRALPRGARRGRQRTGELEVLRGVSQPVDVSIYVWEHGPQDWRLLTNRERKLLWEFRDRRLKRSADRPPQRT